MTDDEKFERAVGALILIAAKCEARPANTLGVELGLLAKDALKDIVGEGHLRMIAEEFANLRHH
ncbi:MAG: hypothetical protein ACR2Q4_22215 [Geminicoccaceae bacterium]